MGLFTNWGALDGAVPPPGEGRTHSELSFDQLST